MRIFFMLVVGLISISPAMAARHWVPGGFHCYSVPTENQNERWCYLQQATDGQPSVMIFNPDRPRPELAAIVELDEQGAPTAIRHGSLAQGQITIVRTQETQLNPMPVPLDEQTLARTAEPLPAPRNLAFDDQVQGTFDQLKAARELPEADKIEEGNFEVMLEESKMPFRGWWWPFEGVPLAKNADSPLQKYDRVVQGWTGANPGAALWELNNHSPKNVEKYGGHCNGWAASAILYPEPKETLYQAASDTTLTPRDIKGMLAEASYCVDYVMFGQRYETSQDDLEDIHAELFHRVIIRYLRDLKKPIAFDYYRNDDVDTHIMSGYKMQVRRIDKFNFDVEVEIRTHRYDKKDTTAVGVASTYRRNYHYQLAVDKQSKLLAGKWTSGRGFSENPDFLWIPLAQKNCEYTTKKVNNRENPNVDPVMIEKMINTLPKK